MKKSERGSKSQQSASLCCAPITALEFFAPSHHAVAAPAAAYRVWTRRPGLVPVVLLNSFKASKQDFYRYEWLQAAKSLAGGRPPCPDYIARSQGSMLVYAHRDFTSGRCCSCWSRRRHNISSKPKGTQSQRAIAQFSVSMSITHTLNSSRVSQDFLYCGEYDEGG